MKTRSSQPTIAEVLKPGGVLADEMPGYEFREEQLQACESIERAFETGSICLVEAGTGVGKTLAYLIPAVRAAAEGKVTVISTHTINLQAQLFTKDIPLVAALFPEVEIRPVLMKGRSNFLCLQDLDTAESDMFIASDPAFQRVKKWAKKTKTGDVGDLPFTFPMWSEVAANQDTCRRNECRYYDRCFYYKMRRSATEANLVVVNHSLFLSDLALRHVEPMSGVLPPYDYVVFDEAHHLEDVATRTFGVEISSKQIPFFVEKLKRLKDLDINVDRLKGIESLNDSLFSPFKGQRNEFFVKDVIDDNSAQLATDCAIDLNASLSELQNELLEKANGDDEVKRDLLQGLARTAGRMREELISVMSPPEPGFIRWGENVTPPTNASRKQARSERTTLHQTPVEVGRMLTDMLWTTTESVALTSATLANSGGFSYVRSRLGVPDDANERVIGSPFDYERQALLYVPRHLPEPPKTSVPAYTRLVASEIERVVNLTGGRAFLLFTSRRMMNEVYEILEQSLEFPLFKQGDQPSGKLLEAFKESGNGCLFGMQSFWEGVDVQGDALSCVIIDRLPFAVPDAPITKARTEAITVEGGDWFSEFSIPMAQIRLKQGFGRLVRTKTDRGIVCLLDTRILTKGYGKEFVKYLPPAARASIWSRVERFWNNNDEG